MRTEGIIKWWWIGLGIAMIYFGVLAISGKERPANGVFAASKSLQPSYELFTAPQSEETVRTVFERDPAVAARLGGLSLEFIQAVPLTSSESRRWLVEGCTLTRCAHVLYYNYSEGGTMEGVVDISRGRVIDLWQNFEARPLASRHTLQKALEIAGRDTRVTGVLGEISEADIVMVPMNIWLLDNACRSDWCVDLTFHDPAGSGKIFHATVNMQRQEIARIFYTRGRPARPYRDIAPQRNAYSDGCEQSYGWSVCWEMTAHDGLDFVDASFDDQLVFRSAKIGQVEVWYPSWPGGYRDEIGHSASVPPYFDTVVEDLGNGFEVRQLFTEFTRWPNCICCYRYEQIMSFYEDGAFEARTVSHGPGCDDLSIYQPMWRIDLDLQGPEEDQAWVWRQDRWIEAIEEQEFELIFDQDLNSRGQKLATFDGELHYRWSYQPNDPLGLDEARVFLVQFREQEGDNPILTGPANSFQPPRQWLDGERVSRDNFVLWYVPLLKTKKGGPWWCMPEPGPDGTPCEAVLRAEPAGPLPAPGEVEPPDPAETIVAPTARPTRTPAAGTTSSETNTGSTAVAIAGENIETVILNAGCAACHVIGSIGDHGKVGPDLTGIAAVAANRLPELSARAYLRRAILYPDEHIVADCPNGPCLAGIMPDYYGERLTAGQLEEILDYLMGEQAADGETASTTDNPAAVPLVPTISVESSGDEPETAAPARVTSRAIGLLAGISLFVVAALGLVVLILRRGR